MPFQSTMERESEIVLFYSRDVPWGVLEQRILWLLRRLFSAMSQPSSLITQVTLWV